MESGVHSSLHSVVIIIYRLKNLFFKYIIPTRYEWKVWHYQITEIVLYNAVTWGNLKNHNLKKKKAKQNTKRKDITRKKNNN